MDDPMQDGPGVPLRKEARLKLRARAGWVSLAAALSGCCIFAAASAGAPIVLRLGPADHDYTFGFRSERERGTSGRWAKAEARIELPFRVRRTSRALLHAGRPALLAAPIEMAQGGASTSRLVGPPAVHAMALQPAPSVRIDLRARDAERNLSVQVFRLTLLPDGPLALLPATGIVVRAALGAAVLAAIFLATGFGGPRSLLASFLLVGLPLSVVGLYDPFAALHLARKAAFYAPLLLAPVALLPRPLARRWLVVLAVALVARCAVYHPSYDYQDVDIHHGVARVAVREGAAELWNQMPHYQQVFDLGRASAGSRYQPFPYPPTFYILAALLPVEDTVDAIKLLGIASQGLVVLMVMILAGRILGPGLPERAAGMLAALFPADLLELLRASYPALLGHALDVGLVTFLVCRWEDLRSNKGVFLVAAGLAAAALTYNAAPVHFGLFVPLLLAAASLKPPLPARTRVVLAALLGAALSLVYYGGYLRWTWEQAHRGTAFAAVRATTEMRMALALGPWETLGVPYLFLAAAGAVVVLKRLWPSSGSRVVLAWALYLPAALALVFLVFEPFRYFRQYHFVHPLFPLLAVGLLGERRSLVMAVTALLVAWNLREIVYLGTPFFTASG
jgi:hypothetical protein